MGFSAYLCSGSVAGCDGAQGMHPRPKGSAHASPGRANVHRRAKRQAAGGRAICTPLRVTFDFSRVDSNTRSSAQKAYVKELITRAGNWLTAALKVRRVAGNLIVSTEYDTQGKPIGCGEDIPEVPLWYATEGVANTDVLIFVLSEVGDESHSCSAGGGVLAYASHCRQDALDRPVVGFIQMCPDFHEPTVAYAQYDGDNSVIYTVSDEPKTAHQKDEDFHTALHEIMHILGMSETLFLFFRDANGTPLTQRCPALPNPLRSEIVAGISDNAGNSLYWLTKKATA